MADDKDVIVITEKKIKDLVSGCGIACVICKSTMSLMRGRAFPICDNCLNVLREIIKERKENK